MSSPVLGGGAASASEAARARALLDAAGRQLTEVRAAASRWQAGLAGVAGGIGIFALVKGRDDIANLTDVAAALYGVALLVALALSVASGITAMRAAFGLPGVMRAEEWELAGSDFREARRAARLLRLAVGLALGSLAALASAVALAWYGPHDDIDPSLLVRSSSGTEICGTVTRVTAGKLVLRTSYGERSVALADVVDEAAVTSCPRR